MKKQLLLLVMMLLPLIASAYDATIGGIYYFLDPGTKEAVVKGNPYKYSGIVDIPASVTYNDSEYNVTSIGDRAFQFCDGLTSVIIPSSVTSIGIYAFSGCSGLTSVTIPESIMIIGEGAFYFCSGLTSFTIPESVIRIGDSAFYGCSGLTSFTFNNNETSIGGGAFHSTAWYDNQPNGLVYAGKVAYAYKGTMPESTKIELSEGTLGIGDYAFSNLGIGDYAPSNNTNLTSITIPNSVVYIGKAAFRGCSGLPSITIPNSVTNIGGSAFEDCKSLTFITILGSVTNIANYTFSGCSSLVSISIPTSVTSIGEKAFCGCSSLLTFTLPESITTIGDWAFYRCSSLTSITFPNSLTNIGNYTFFECSSLTSLTIPSSITSIGEGTFDDCSSLTTVTIPSSITNIGYCAFSGCKRISSVYISDLSAWCKIKYDSNAGPLIPSFYHLYINGDEIKQLTIPNDITNIGDYAFYGCSYFTSITIPSSVITIGEGAFENCRNAEELKMSDNLQIIKKNTFKGCRNLRAIIIPSAVEFIYQEAFANCDALLSVKALPEIPPFLYDNSFSNFSVPLKVPKGCKEAYQTAQGWKNFKNINDVDKYKLTYVVDNEEYRSYEIEEGTTITSEPAPTKEGYTFSGWSEMPETMPAHDVTVTGTFSINKYKLIYTVDGEEYKNFEVEYGATITPEAEPTKEGYTFSGWSEIPETMPAHDVTVTGSFSINKYKLTYTVDGTEYKSYEVEYGANITPEAAPAKEGYTFSGWSEIPETMPAHDMTVTGTFSVNRYKLTYMIDDKVYKETTYEYGATITPEPKPEGNYDTFEWKDLPETMPAYDVVVYASYTSGIIEVIMASQHNVRIYSPNGKKLNKLQKGLNIVILDDGTVKKVIMK